MKATVGRIWEAASSDSSRPVLTHVRFDAEKATLLATNSYIAARVPCEVEPGDESGLIPAVAIKEAAGRSLRIADGKATLFLPDGERAWNLLTDGEFPDVEGVLDAAPVAPTRFGINAGLLASLSAALGASPKHHQPVALHPVHPLKGMRIEATDATGVLMPVRIVDGGQPAAEPPDLSDDGRVVAAARAAVAQLNQRRGKAKAAKAFRAALAPRKAA
jgi:hypothetical protein